MSTPRTAWNLVPWPASLEPRPGSFRRVPGSRVLLSGALRAEIAEMAGRFAESRGLPLAVGEARPGDLALQPRDGTEGEDDESYSLEVDQGVLILEASSPTGFARAAATLDQLGEEFPALRIDDRPRFPWRGLLLDCSRHFVPVDAVLRVLDLLAAHKMNRFHWHLTDDQGWRLAVEDFPRLAEVAAWRRGEGGARVGGCYDEGDVQRVVEHASRLGIVVVPEIELPGHSTAALAAHPELSCTGGPFEVETRWGIFDDVYCAGNDATLRFLERVFDQVLRQFPGPYVHLGGDECPKARWKDCPRCQVRIRAEGLDGEDALQSWFVSHFGRYLAERGRRFLGWDEILEGGLPEGAIVQSWQGMEGARAAARAGHDTVVSPMSHCYLDFNLAHLDVRRAYAFDPVPPELDATESRHVLGGECNLWTERAPPDKLDQRLFPRMPAVAERLWSGTGGEVEDFLRRMRARQPQLEGLGVRFGDYDDPGHSSKDRFDWTVDGRPEPVVPDPRAARGA